jgi:hypothetical protein
VSVTSNLSEYFAYAKATFDQAFSKTEPVTRDYQIGAYRVRLDFAGEPLADLFLDALEHNRLAVDASMPTECDLEVFLWDSVSTGVSLLPPDWEAITYTERGNRRMFSNGEYVLIYDRRTSAFNLIDLIRGQAIYWVRDASWLPFYEIAAPLRYLFQGWLQIKGDFVMHSAAVGFPEGGALIVGPTGSGKSSTSLACINSMLGFAGDDYILVRAGPQPVAYSLYNSAKINADDLGRFPHLVDLVSNHDRLDIEKALVFLHKEYGEQLITQFPLRVLILPQVGDGPDTTLERISAIEAFKHLAPDSVFTMLGNARLIVSGVRELTSTLPCYRCTLGQDVNAMLEVIADVITEHTNS